MARDELQPLPEYEPPASTPDDLTDELRELAKTLPVTYEEIAEVAEFARHMGVKRENIAAFSLTMIDLGQSTNMSAAEAATAIEAMRGSQEEAPEDPMQRALQLRQNRNTGPQQRQRPTRRIRGGHRG